MQSPIKNIIEWLATWKLVAIFKNCLKLCHYPENNPTKFCSFSVLSFDQFLGTNFYYLFSCNIFTFLCPFFKKNGTEMVKMQQPFGFDLTYAYSEVAMAGNSHK